MEVKPYNPTYQRFPLILRAISLILIVTFLAQDIVWAYPDVLDHNRAQDNKLAAQSFFKDPESIPKAYAMFLDDIITNRALKEASFKNEGSPKEDITLQHIVYAIKAIAQEDAIWFENNNISYRKIGEDEITISFYRGSEYMLRYFELDPEITNHKRYPSNMKLITQGPVNKKRRIFKQLLKAKDESLQPAEPSARKPISEQAGSPAEDILAPGERETPPAGMIPWLWGKAVPYLRDKGWSDKKIAFWCGFAEETAIGGILGILSYIAGADSYTGIILAASAAAFILYFIAHVKGVYRFNEGNLSEPAKSTKDDLGDIALLGLNTRLVYLFLLASISPYSAILAILTALIAASIWHAIYDGVIAPRYGLAVGMAGRPSDSDEEKVTIYGYQLPKRLTAHIDENTLSYIIETIGELSSIPALKKKPEEMMINFLLTYNVLLPYAGQEALEDYLLRDEGRELAILAFDQMDPEVLKTLLTYFDNESVIEIFADELDPLSTIYDIGYTRFLKKLLSMPDAGKPREAISISDIHRGVFTLDFSGTLLSEIKLSGLEALMRKLIPIIGIKNMRKAFRKDPLGFAGALPAIYNMGLDDFISELNSLIDKCGISDSIGGIAGIEPARFMDIAAGMPSVDPGVTMIRILNLVVNRPISEAAVTLIFLEAEEDGKIARRNRRITAADIGYLRSKISYYHNVERSHDKLPTVGCKIHLYRIEGARPYSEGDLERITDELAGLGITTMPASLFKGTRDIELEILLEPSYSHEIISALILKLFERGLLDRTRYDIETQFTFEGDLTEEAKYISFALLAGRPYEIGYPQKLESLMERQSSILISGGGKLKDMRREKEKNALSSDEGDRTDFLGFMIPHYNEHEKDPIFRVPGGDIIAGSPVFHNGLNAAMRNIQLLTGALKEYIKDDPDPAKDRALAGIYAGFKDDMIAASGQLGLLPQTFSVNWLGRYAILDRLSRENIWSKLYPCLKKIFEVKIQAIEAARKGDLRPVNMFKRAIAEKTRVAVDRIEEHLAGPAPETRLHTSSVRFEKLPIIIKLAQHGLTPPIKAIRLWNIPESEIPPRHLKDFKGFERLNMDLLRSFDPGGSIRIDRPAESEHTDFIGISQVHTGKDLFEEIEGSAGRNDMDRLGCVGKKAGTLLAKLHKLGIICADPHTKNYVVSESGDVYRINLRYAHVFSADLYDACEKYGISGNGLNDGGIFKGPMPDAFAMNEICATLIGPDYIRGFEDAGRPEFAIPFLRAYIDEIGGGYKYARGYAEQLIDEISRGRKPKYVEWIQDDASKPPRVAPRDYHGVAISAGLTGLSWQAGLCFIAFLFVYEIARHIWYARFYKNLLDSHPKAARIINSFLSSPFRFPPSIENLIHGYISQPLLNIFSRIRFHSPIAQAQLAGTSQRITVFRMPIKFMMAGKPPQKPGVAGAESVTGPSEGVYQSAESSASHGRFEKIKIQHRFSSSPNRGNFPPGGLFKIVNVPSYPKTFRFCERAWGEFEIFTTSDEKTFYVTLAADTSSSPSSRVEYFSLTMDPALTVKYCYEGKEMELQDEVAERENIFIHGLEQSFVTGILKELIDSRKELVKHPELHHFWIDIYRGPKEWKIFSRDAYAVSKTRKYMYTVARNYPICDFYGVDSEGILIQLAEFGAHSPKDLVRKFAGACYILMSRKHAKGIEGARIRSGNGLTLNVRLKDIDTTKHFEVAAAKLTEGFLRRIKGHQRNNLEEITVEDSSLLLRITFRVNAVKGHITGNTRPEYFKFPRSESLYEFMMYSQEYRRRKAGLAGAGQDTPPATPPAGAADAVKKEPKGSLPRAIVTINASKKLCNGFFTKDEFQEARKKKGDPASNTTVYSELNGLVAVGILEVDDSVRPYNYCLTGNYKGAPPQIKRQITLYLKTLRARPAKDNLLEVGSIVRGMIGDVSAAGVSLINSGIDRMSQKTLIYPASSNSDAENIEEVLNMFPNINKVVLVDPSFDGLYKVSEDLLFYNIIEFIGFKIKGKLETKGVFGKGGTITVKAKKYNRVVEFVFYSEDYYKVSKMLKGAADVVLVKYPGEGGDLSEDAGFYLRVKENLRLGGLALVRDACLPNRKVKGLRLIFCTNIEGQSNYESVGDVDLNDWAVLQKVGISKDGPESTAPAEARERLLSFMDSFILKMRDRAHDLRNWGVIDYIGNRLLAYTGDKKIRADSEKELMATAGCLSCAPVICQSGDGDEKINHLLHFIGPRNADKKLEAAASAIEFDKVFGYAKDKGALFVIPFDEDRAEVFEALSRHILKDYQKSRVMLVTVRKGLVKAVLVAKEGVSLTAGEHDPGCMSVSKEDSRQNIILTWNDIRSKFTGTNRHVVVKAERLLSEAASSVNSIGKTGDGPKDAAPAAGAAAGPASVADYDRRPVDGNLLHRSYVRHDMAVKQIVNPDNKPLKAVYGGAGADISNFLLSTNAAEAYFISHYKNISGEELKKCLKTPEEYIVQNLLEDYYMDKFPLGHAISSHLADEKQIIAAIAFELRAIGVDLGTVQVNSYSGHPRITFQWNYMNETSRLYSITFVNADITNPEQYRHVLEGENIDIYYQRSAEEVPLNYSQGSDSFIASINNYLKPGGYFITDDYAFDYDKSIFFDMGPQFPIPLAEIEIPLTEDIEKDISGIPTKKLRSKEAFYYGWRVRIRQKPVPGAAELQLPEPDVARIEAPPAASDSAKPAAKLTAAPTTGPPPNAAGTSLGLPRVPFPNTPQSEPAATVETAYSYIRSAENTGKKPASPDMAKPAGVAGFDNTSDGDTANPFILEHIDEGRAIEVYDKEEKVVRIKRDRSNPRAPPVESHFKANGTFEKIRKAKDPALLKKILREKRNFRNLSPEEQEELIRIIRDMRLSFILGHVVIGERPADYIMNHVRTGLSRYIHNLEPTIWIGEILFNRLTIEQLAQSLLEEAQHILRPPRRAGNGWINSHGKIDDAVAEGRDPSHVIEHDRALIDALDESPATIEELAATAEAENPESPDMNKEKLLPYGEDGQGMSPKDIRSRIVELDGSEIIDSENEHFVLDVKELKNSVYPVVISIKKKSDLDSIGTVQLDVSDTLVDGKYILSLGFADIAIKEYQGRGIFPKILSLISKIMPPNSELHISSLEETKTLKALASGISWNGTRMGRIFYRCGWKPETISIFDRTESSTAVLLDRANRWPEFYSPQNFMAILAGAIRDIDDTDQIDGATVLVRLSKIRKNPLVKPGSPDMAKEKAETGEDDAWVKLAEETRRLDIKDEESDIAVIVSESLPYSARRKAVKNLFAVYDVSKGNLNAIMLAKDWLLREEIFEEKLGNLLAALTVAQQELLRKRTDRTEAIKADNDRLLRYIALKIKEAEEKLTNLTEENGFNASVRRQIIPDDIFSTALMLGRAVNRRTRKARDIISDTAKGKALILYADDVLERGTAADLAYALKKTSLLDNSVIVLYGRRPGRAELLEKIINSSAQNKNINIISITPEDMRSLNGGKEINVEFADEAKELDLLLRHIGSRHHINNGVLLGVVKGRTDDSYKEGIRALAKDRHVPVVSFEHVDSNDADKEMYSFVEALGLLISISKDITPLKDREWFKLLKPIKKKDIERAYQDYRRALEVAINA